MKRVMQKTSREFRLAKQINNPFIDKVEKVDGMKGGKVLIDGEALPLSDTCKAAFFELLSHRSITLG